jgi:general secretion pathway protein L
MTGPEAIHLRFRVIVRFIKLPISTKENLRKVLEYEIPKYTPFERGELYFDYEILKEEKGWLHLFAVFVKKVEVDYCLALMKKIGIQPVSIQIPSIAALNLFYFNEGVKRGEISVLLDVGDSSFDTNLIQEGNWIESFHLALPKEEKEARMISTLKRMGLKEDSLPKSTFFVYGLGGDEKLLASLKEMNQVKGVFPPPMTRVETGKGIYELNKIYASIGLPLKGIIKTRLDLNLLPLEMKKKVRQIGRPFSIFLVLLAFFLSLTWGAGIFFQYRDELEAVTAEIKKRRPEVEAVEKLQKQKEAMTREILEFEKIRSGEPSKVEILKELTQLLPGAVWIWNFKYNGREIEISGYADSASELIPLLDKSSLFERVEFLSPVTKERQFKGAGDKEKERFKIKVRVEGRKS